MPDANVQLPDLIAAEPALAARLRACGAGETVVFEQVAPQAQPVLCAALAGAVRRRLWLVCHGVREQEQLHNELTQWRADALFFPELEIAPVEGAIPDPEAVAERLAIVQRLAQADGKGRAPVIVLTRRALGERVVDAAELKRLQFAIQRGARLDRDALLEKLAAAGYEQAPQVSARGQYAVRGGIVDVFSFQHALPVRIEWFDDEVESIREFDPDAQTSVERLEKCTLLLGEAESLDRTLEDYIGAEDVTVSVDAAWDGARISITSAAAGRDDGAPLDYSLAFFDHGLGEFEAGDFVVDEFKRERFFAQLAQWRAQRWAVFIFCNNEGEIERLRELLPPVEAGAVRFAIGVLARGFIFPAGRVAVLSDAELFGRYRNTRSRRLAMKRAREQAHRQQIDFSELIEGELVVHLEHGIARFEELRRVGGEEVLVLTFAENTKLYVPLEQSCLVARYVGIGKRNPPLSKLGDGAWSNAKKKAEKAVLDYAARLLEMHAIRETQTGHAFAPDSHWMREFESSFLHKETDDQLRAIAETKADMESERPMDRLICGDVGFGKTEVAIRAAFKAVCGGRQVAILVPTTVLAEQHYRTFRERMSDYPVTVGLLSRFRTRGQQNETIRGLADGSVDIVIGTHRLVSQDVQFKNLGLVVIDEEQRFGVLHKERLKTMWPLVDMLTLSATPIPRTLYLSLMGAKDMSTIETPPPNRIPVETLICPYDERIIRDAIHRELARDGQVYFLHNRIGDIELIARKIQHLCPKARVLIGHGQMDERELEDVMHRFVAGEADVLVATTIIESGVDIPNANTIIIDRADRFGLADLYQLRGRVGRAQHKAWAYLMLPRGMIAAGEAHRRISAIKQYGSLGAGFKIAMRDLEIRGAGNILGTAQSGHIVNIGFDLYCALLRQAIARLKGDRRPMRADLPVRLHFLTEREAAWKNDTAPAFLPVSFLADTHARIAAYRRLAETHTQEQLDALRKEWRDRYGRLPAAVENLLLLTTIKLAATAKKITAIESRDDGKLLITRNGEPILLGTKLPRLHERDPGAKLRELLALVRSL